MVEEMTKFRKFLDDAGIEWIDKSEEFNGYKMDRTHFEYRGNLVSVINGYGSYGGINIINGKNLGLLEVMIGNDEPVGNLTCDEAIKYIFDECEECKI